jgi:hypothetical protein
VEDENERKYVRTAEIPDWMASTLGKLVPLVLIAVVGAGISLWGESVLVADRLARLERFAEMGDRCTARQCADAAERIKELEQWRERHIQDCYQRIYRRQSEVTQ